MPTLPQPTDTFGFPIYILIRNQTCHQKATVLTIPNSMLQLFGCVLILLSLKSFKDYFYCRGHQKYFPDENITLSLNSCSVSGS